MEAHDLLRRGAEAGDINAMAELGQFLYSTPRADEATLEEGVRLTHAAADRGHVDAAHFAAVIAANDPTIPQHWAVALAFAARAATSGHGLAQFELAFLARNWALLSELSRGKQPPASTWTQLAEAVDIGALTATLPPQAVSRAPYVAIAERFITPEMCDWLIRRAKPLLTRAHLYNPTGGGGMVMRRTNSEMYFSFPAFDLVVLMLRQRIVNLTGLGHKGLEQPSVLHYAPGEEFSPHYDYLNPKQPALAAEIARTGQRVATVLVYLSGEFTGGETDFVNAGVRLKGNKGDAIFFRNVDETGAPDVKTLHAGRAPIRGDKWLFSQFLRADRPPPGAV